MLSNKHFISLKNTPKEDLMLLIETGFSFREVLERPVKKVPTLSGKNILIIIPKDYYDEEELEIPYELFKSEDANIIVASSKMKEAVGMKTGRRMPDRLIVDCMEGITGWKA